MKNFHLFLPFWGILIISMITLSCEQEEPIRVESCGLEGKWNLKESVDLFGGILVLNYLADVRVEPQELALTNSSDSVIIQANWWFLKKWVAPT